MDAANGIVQERYTYDHFGNRTILEPNGTTGRNSSDFNMNYGYTSRRHDNESGLVYFRARFYDSATGEFASRDPLEYIDGMSVMRAYFLIDNVDPYGLQENGNTDLGAYDEGFDERGKEILYHWIYGEGRDFNRHEGVWGDYMRANELLRSSLAKVLRDDCLARTETGLFGETIHAEIEDGYTTGYEMLHGSNARVGDFRIDGVAAVFRNAKGESMIEYQSMRYTWNDIIDAKFTIDGELNIDDIILWLFFQGLYRAKPTDYNLKISWIDTARCWKNCDGEITMVSGWPFVPVPIARPAGRPIIKPVDP